MAWSKVHGFESGILCLRVAKMVYRSEKIRLPSVIVSRLTDEGGTLVFVRHDACYTQVGGRALTLSSSPVATGEGLRVRASLALFAPRRAIWQPAGCQRGQ